MIREFRTLKRKRLRRNNSHQNIKLNNGTRLIFRKYRRKPISVKMAKVTANIAKKILKNGINGKKVSISNEDIEFINKKNNEIVGYIATDRNSYWFVNFDYAKKHFIT